MSDTQTVKMRLPLPAGKQIGECNNEEISEAMDAEIAAFSNWLLANNKQGLYPVERSLVKIYLSWKLVYENAGSVSKTA